MSGRSTMTEIKKLIWSYAKSLISNRVTNNSIVVYD